MMAGRLRKRLRSLLHRSRVEQELDLELQFHLDMLTAQQARAGLPPAAARRAAARAFGTVAGVKDDVRDVWLGQRIAAGLEDLRYGIRTLRAAPAFAAAIVVTIALAVGVNAAIFAVAYSLLLRPLPFADPGSLVVLRHGSGEPSRPMFSAKELDDYRTTIGLDGVAELHTMWFILLPAAGHQGERSPERVSTGVVSANYFALLGIRPMFGRLLTADDDRPGAPAVLLLTHDYWQRAFHGDPSVVGRTFEMNDRPHTVVGILPPFPQYSAATDVYMPTSACPFRSGPEATSNRRARMGLAIARLAEGNSIERIQPELARVAARLERQEPGVYRDESAGPYRASALSFAGEMRRQLRPTMLLLVATAALVLLIACVSVGNLSMTRLTRRAREVSLRTALGATRLRVLRQLLGENVAAVAAGTLLGLLLAQIALPSLTIYVRRASSIPVDQGLSLVAIVCAVSVSIVLLVVSAAAPVLMNVRRMTNGRSERMTGRIRGRLVAAQVALSFVLMVAAALSVRSLLELQGIDAGFTVANVQTLRLDLNFTKYHDGESITAFWRQIEGRLSDVPGVVAVGGTGMMPLDGQRPGSSLYTVHRNAAVSGDDVTVTRAPRANFRVASAGYFEAIGQQFLHGRTFDDESGLQVIVNDALARRWWPAGDAVGRTLQIEGLPPAVVVAVVEDARQTLDEPPGEEIYFPLFRSGQLSTRWLVRSTLTPVDLEARVRAIVGTLDGQQPVDDFRSLASFRDDFLLPSRVTASVVGLFSILALIITAAGIAGVVGNAVQQRRREFGVRLALGAPRARVLAMVLRHGLSFVVAGLAAGICASLPVLPLVRQLPAGANPFDPLALALVSSVLLLVAAVACLVPAIRAARVDPLVVLRSE